MTEATFAEWQHFFFGMSFASVVWAVMLWRGRDKGASR